MEEGSLYKKDLDSPENFMWQVALSLKLMEHLPIMQMYVDDCEADDIIGWLARHKFKAEKREIIICSADLDMHLSLIHI